jgi:hypothetical protein
MAFLIVGGSARGVGKTTVVCELIRAFRDMAPIAIKVASHPHAASAAWRVVEEHSSIGDKDTARYLQAGAARALLLSIPADTKEGFTHIEKEFGGESLVILESTRAAGRVKASFSLYVTAPGVQEEKSYTAEAATRFDVTVSNERLQPNSTGLPSLIQLGPQGDVPVEILQGIRQKITANSSK